jgi:hypothetical protein
VVGSGASLIIEGCAVVRMAADTSIVVDDEAVGFVADGSAERPIVIERADAGAAWRSVNAFGPATLRLQHTTIPGGGTSQARDDAEFAGTSVAVRVFGNDDVDLLFVDTVVIEDSTGVGVLLQGAGFIDVAVDPRTRIEQAVIRFAGGESTTTGVCPAAQGASSGDADGAVIVFTAEAPSSAFITNTAIEHSAGCGIYRGWSVDGVDFTDTNTFSDLGGCAQSNVSDANSGCDTGPCL